ncbi:OLC1v1002022C1 [Oldenlandia corymbosa var. corymbosa]|uniref:OLC1v1002022C1 n=1 Tax=Oldenlandia corymbosa var. corymbosa TaxID=529605 RepID=A0AAV1D7C7_OLDCO|nr:OLC1v1002022C1 [Oldenlandia corymbosa var. corymbosa]
MAAAKTSNQMIVLFSLCMVLAALNSCICLHQEDIDPSLQIIHAKIHNLHRNGAVSGHNNPGGLGTSSVKVHGGIDKINVRRMLQIRDCPFCPGCGCPPVDDCKNCCAYVGCQLM